MAKKAAQNTPAKRGRKPKPAGEKNRPISASLPPDLVARLAAYERRHAVTRSQAVTEAVRRLLG